MFLLAITDFVISFFFAVILNWLVETPFDRLMKAYMENKKNE
jgi:peptidoglycan/LPS O-acetylase OafA/YrhL